MLEGYNSALTHAQCSASGSAEMGTSNLLFLLLGTETGPRGCFSCLGELYLA